MRTNILPSQYVSSSRAVATDFAPSRVKNSRTHASPPHAGKRDTFGQYVTCQMGTVVTTELIAEMAEKKWKNPRVFSGRRRVLMQAHTDYCTDCT